MDLVKSYDSEKDGNSSDIEEIYVPVPEKTKEIDVIELSDSEDEYNDKVTENKDKPNTRPTTPQINYIDIDVTPEKRSCSDVQLPAKKSPPRKTLIDANLSSFNHKNSPEGRASEVSSVINSNSQKKIDYLNLEGSDSENEYESTEKDISDLMDTASVLTEMPCGPEKPTNLLHNIDCRLENASLTKQNDKTVASKFKADSNSSRNTPDLVQNITSCELAENSHLDVSDKDSAEPFPLVNNKTLSCIYREDKRIIDASKKIIVCRIPRQIIQTHNAHSKLITSLNWCVPKFSYLFLSASQDGSIKIWDLYRTNSVQCIKVNSGLNTAKWSLDGFQIVAGGFEKKAFVYDVQTGKKIVQYDIYNFVTSMECHPYMEDVFLVGTKNAVLGFDVRVGTTFPIRSFFSQCEEVLDIAFIDENEFICSTNIVSHDSADRTIMAWDFASGAILSQQIYLERFTCPSLKVHPSDSSFIAQSNGNYIAAFSTHRPYKMKDKKYTGHKVSGYGIECDISPDGKYAVSGDVEGSLYFYNYSTTSVVLVTPKRKSPTNRVKWHPILPSTLICSNYDGQINIWK